MSIEWVQAKEVVDDDCFFPIPFDMSDEGVFEKDMNIVESRRIGSHVSF